MDSSIQKEIPSPCSFMAIGVMSGTSLDGLDLCYAKFDFENQKWNYKINKTTTIPYSKDFKQTLSKAIDLSGEDLAQLNSELGAWIGNRINEFKSDLEERIDLIGSHGHTVFHNPKRGFSTQIGSGAHIAALTGIPCVCDFRTGDVARGGQGAPLVPIGDELLFGEFDFCLNIGGIANISYNQNNQQLAYDICPANMALNHIANALGKEFDDNGSFGKTGEVNEELLEELNHLVFYGVMGAKSLGREWFEGVFLTTLNKHNLELKDLMRTVYEHIATKISNALTLIPKGSVLITGGGAKNQFLVELIKQKCNNTLVIPEPILVDFKEALIFAFLAVLYKLQIPSCLASVTGARNNSIGGCLYY